MGPGIFILVSGFTLTLSALSKNDSDINIKEFYFKRLARIFPLYLVIHLIVILIGVLLDEDLGFDPSKVFLSMLGLRFTDGLFFYINPSWWFMWLILQLYLIFPLLLRLLIKKGISTFIIITVGFTMLSRLAGLLNVTYSSHLEYWMTGIFAGTRLSEFAAGMILAKLLSEKRFDPVKVNITTLSLISTAVYLSGFICSLFYISTLISNILITVGLTGILISFSRIIESGFPSLINAVKWIGVVSFPVFLLHQPLMLWAGNDLSSVSKVLVEASVLVLVFPSGWLIEKIVNQAIVAFLKINSRIFVTLLLLSISVQVLLNLAYFVTMSELIYKADFMLFIINIFSISVFLIYSNKNISKSVKSVLIVFIPASALFAFLLTRNWFCIFWIFWLVLLIMWIIIRLLTENQIIRVCSSYILVIILFVLTESWLIRNHPVDVDKWGELPALQKDPLTVYSLIPDKITHLRYFNYDYFVKTNSLGFNGPDLDLNSSKDSNEIRILIIGDAFTMPEGMEYEKAYPELLQACLRENYPGKKYMVINAGVTGYGPIEMYAQLVKYIDTLKPDIFINEIFINEFEEINLDEKQRLNSIGLRKFSVREKWFAGSQIPQQIRFGFNKVLNSNSYKRYTYNKSLVQFYELNSDFFMQDNISKIREYLLKVRLLCENKNCRPFILYAPGQMEISSPDMISYYPRHLPLNDTLKFDFQLPVKIYKKLCVETHLPFFDPTAALKANSVQPVYFTGSWHWNEEGHKVIAGFLAGEISKIID